MGDRVVVKFTSLKTQTAENWSTAKVIGFETNPKSCGFRFKITRDDGTLITHTLLRYIYIISSTRYMVASAQFYHPIDAEYWTEANGVWTYSRNGRTFSYDTNTGYWTIQFWPNMTNLDTGVTIPFAADPAGYFVSYDDLADEGLPTQYPYRWKTADKENVADLIQPGTFEDRIPYFWSDSVTNQPDPVPELAPWINMPCSARPGYIEAYPDFYFDYGLGFQVYYHTQLSWSRTLTVKSSVEYIHREVYPGAVGQYIGCFGYAGNGRLGELACPQVSDLCLSYSASVLLAGELLDKAWETDTTPVGQESLSDTHPATFAPLTSPAGVDHILNMTLTPGNASHTSTCWEPIGGTHTLTTTANFLRVFSNKRLMAHWMSIGATPNI